MNNVIEAIVMTCPRCGKQIIRPKIGEKDLDGGFTRYAEYEPVPSDWEYLNEYSQHFCAMCAREYRRRLSGFLDKKGCSNE